MVAWVYFSPADSSYIHNTNTRTDYYNIISEQVIKYRHSKDIFICGDLNSRRGQLIDYHENIPGTEGGLNYIDEYAKNVLNTVQDCFSRDNCINEYGRKLIDFCKSSCYHIMNGRLGDVPNTGDFTCYKGNGASLVDYLLGKPSSMSMVKEFSNITKQVYLGHISPQINGLIMNVKLLKWQ